MKILGKGISKMMNKKIISIIMVLIISMLVTSCAGPTELDELGMLISLGIDIENEKILLTSEIMVPKGATSDVTGEPTVVFVQSTGDTIFDAFRNATLEFDRKIFLSHNRIIVFGEELAKRGIGDYINFFLYDNEPRETAYMLVAKGAKAYDVLGVNSGLGGAPGVYLKGLIENYIHTSKTRSLNLTEYIKYYFGNGTPVLGVVQKVETMKINREHQQTEALDLTGGAIFDRDKLIGYYTGDEMIGFNFIVDEIEGGLIVFETPDELSEDNKLIAKQGKFTVMEIISSRTKNDIKIIDDKINLTINVTLKGVLGEETKGLMLSELNIKNAIQKACSDKIEEYIRMTMDKAQKEFQLDSFSINELYHKKYPKEWKKIENEWHSIFPDITYTVNVNTDMIRTSLIDIPINIEKGRE